MATKLTITVCTVDASGSVTGTDSTKKFSVMLNPANIRHNKNINYTGLNKEGSQARIALGAPAASPQFKNTGSSTLNLDIVIDGTGVVPDTGVTAQNQDTFVSTQIKNLSDIVYGYDGDSHEPYIVRLVWGGLSFDGRLTSMNVDYTLFKSSGDPLRAKVTLNFTDYTSIKQAALEANMSSPDLTHLVEVRDGDSLPLMCYHIYQDNAYYLEVAKVNGITNFRDLKPGTKIYFPPLR